MKSTVLISARAVNERRRTLKALASLASLAVTQVGFAQAYPSKPIHVLVPASPGGATDVMARIVSNGVSQEKGWTFVVENLAGTGGNQAMKNVAEAAKDGYTLGLGQSSNLVVNPFLFKNLPFNAEKDFEPVILLAKIPLVLVVGASSRYDSVASLINASKTKPMSFASAGIGTIGHLTGELWKRQLGNNVIHVPYKSAAPAMTDVASGVIDFFFASIASAAPLIKAGKARALAVTSATRSPMMADVPSFDELGSKGFDAAAIYGIVAPKNTPASIVSLLNKEMNAVLSRPAVRETMANLGVDTSIIGGNPQLFASLLFKERAKWGQVVKDAAIKPE